MNFMGADGAMAWACARRARRRWPRRVIRCAKFCGSISPARRPTTKQLGSMEAHCRRRICSRISRCALTQRTARVQSRSGRGVAAIGLNSTSPFIVRTFASTPAFRDATLAPGWVAAFTEGDWIGTQPLRTLTARHLLAGTMRHEFLHALVEQQAGAERAALAA